MERLLQQPEDIIYSPLHSYVPLLPHQNNTYIFDDYLRKHSYSKKIIKTIQTQTLIIYKFMDN